MRDRLKSGSRPKAGETAAGGSNVGRTNRPRPEREAVSLSDPGNLKKQVSAGWDASKK